MRAHNNQKRKALMAEQWKKRRANDEGFTLIELLIVIVIIGILSTVVVLAVGGITNKGSTASCSATADASTAAAAAFYAQDATNQWPTTFTAMTGATPALLKVQGGATVAANTVTGKGWTLTMAGGGATEPTFTCGP